MNLTILWIILITIFATVLRLIGIVKSGGMWNDEYISWQISTIPLGKEFLKGIASQCHMPFYYLYLKIFSHFSNDDLIYRISSLIPSILSVPVMYFVGKEKNKLTGVICALFVAVSSFLIYFAQEIRFYSVLFLFSALSLLFTFKLIKKINVRNFIGLLISNFLIIFTHTIGFVYVFFNLVFITVKLKNYKKIVTATWVTLSLIILPILPLLLKIFSTVSFSQWWAPFSFNRILQLFVDYFTPVTSQVMLLENINGSQMYATLVLLSALCAFIVITLGFIYKPLKEETNIGYVAISVIVIMIIASLCGKLVFESKYAIETYPILIYLFCSTIISINKKRIKIPILLIFFLIQICYAFSPDYTAKLPRNEGHKYISELIKNAKLKQNDYIVLTYYPKNRFEKYQDFSKFNVIEIHKGNFNEYYLPELTYKEAVKEGKNKYRGTFINATFPVSEFPGSKLIFFIDENLYFKMKIGQKVSFLFLDNVSFFDETTFTSIVTDNKLYKKTPLLYLVFSDIRNEIIKTIPLNAKNIRFESIGSWTLVTFER